MSDERRVAQRFSRRLRTEVGSLALYTSNVSATGIQLVCPGHSLTRFRGMIDEEHAQITLTLTDGRPVQARCKLAYVSEHDDEYLLGLHFERFDGDGAAVWTSYLDAGAR
ncbi:MAG: PilZ domain-containing protein [Gammaproteobacteria bacterium]|nr:PilZ domain-containing protein [Gammaproteobacteria bacterium]